MTLTFGLSHIAASVPIGLCAVDSFRLGQSGESLQTGGQLTFWPCLQGCHFSRAPLKHPHWSVASSCAILLENRHTGQIQSQKMEFHERKTH